MHYTLIIDYVYQIVIWWDTSKKLKKLCCTLIELNFILLFKLALVLFRNMKKDK